MEFSDLIINRAEVTVMGVPVTVRLHSRAFRNFVSMLALEGRRIEQEQGADGKTRTTVLDAGSMDHYRRIVRETVKDGVVKWGLKLADGTEVGTSEEALLALEQAHPEFLAEVFDAVESFNTPLSGAKKKT
jgi:hypothetical protein